MTERVGVTAFPLYWPIGRPRSQRRQRAIFRDSNVYRETQEVRHELELLGARKVIVSTNLMLRNDGIPYAGQKQPGDPGVAVWFDLRGVQHALACDSLGSFRGQSARDREARRGDAWPAPVEGGDGAGSVRGLPGAPRARGW